MGPEITRCMLRNLFRDSRKNYNLASPEGTIYYYLENRRVTENFVDPSGAKITPPTGYTQGKQT